MAYLINDQRVTGKITRPAPGDPAAEVTLTAKIQRGEDITTKPFDITIRPWTHLEIVEYEAQILTHAALYLPLNTNENNIQNDLNLKTSGFMGCDISWTSSANEYISADTSVAPLGTVSRPSYTIGDQICILTATITSGAAPTVETKSIEYRFTIKALPQTNEEAANAYLLDNSKFAPSTWTTGVDAGYDPTTPGYVGITSALVLPMTDGLFSIIWESSDPTSLDITLTGAVPILKPVSGVVVLTAKVKYGTYTTTNSRAFNIRIAQEAI